MKFKEFDSVLSEHNMSRYDDLFDDGHSWLVVTNMNHGTNIEVFRTGYPKDYDLIPEFLYGVVRFLFEGENLLDFKRAGTVTKGNSVYDFFSHRLEDSEPYIDVQSMEDDGLIRTSYHTFDNRKVSGVKDGALELHNRFKKMIQWNDVPESLDFLQSLVDYVSDRQENTPVKVLPPKKEDSEVYYIEVSRESEGVFLRALFPIGDDLNRNPDTITKFTDAVKNHIPKCFNNMFDKARAEYKENWSELWIQYAEDIKRGKI